MKIHITRTLLNRILLPFLLLLILCRCTKNNTANSNSIVNQIDTLIEYAADTSKTNQERIKSLEKADSLTGTLPDDSIKIRKYKEISLRYYWSKDYKRFKKTGKKILFFASAIYDSTSIATAHRYLGVYYRFRLLDSAFYHFYKAEKIYSTYNHTNDLDTLVYSHGRVLIDLAKLFRKVKNYNESEALTIQAIEKFELSGNATYLPLSYTNLGIISKQVGNYENAILYFQKSIEHTKNTDKEILYTIIGNNNIGTTYKSQEKYEMAKKHYKKVLKHKDFLKKDSRRFALLIDNLAYVNFLSKDTTNLPKDFFTALEIRDSINDKNGITTSNLHLTEYYQSIGKDSIAIQYAEQAKNVSLETNENDDLLQSYKLLSELGDTKSKLYYAKAHIQLTDSILKQERTYRDKFARIRFDTAQKEQQIKEVKGQNTLYLLGICLVMIFTGFIIYFSRQRTQYLSQQNKMVQFQASYETETRIAKRLHDELGNDIFQTILQYQDNPHHPQIIDRLNTAYSKARDISRENNDFETDKNYPKELRNMLQNYTQNNIRLVLKGFDNIPWNNFQAPIKITIYRVLQELMTNMQKHSTADLVALVFSNTNNLLTINYSDNGLGMTEKQVGLKNGLSNAKNRIHAIQGTLIIDAEKDKGFKAEIQIPC